MLTTPTLAQHRFGVSRRHNVVFGSLNHTLPYFDYVTLFAFSCLVILGQDEDVQPMNRRFFDGSSDYVVVQKLRFESEITR